MNIDYKTYLIVCPMVFLAGFVDSIGGGGGLISLPAYLIAGLSPHFAIATNKISATAGTIASTIKFCKSNATDWHLLPFILIPSFTGAQIGTRLSLLASDEFLKTVMLIFIPVLVYAILMGKKEQNELIETNYSIKTKIIVSIICFLIGTYDGFYGPCTGTFLILSFVNLVKISSIKALKNAKLSNLASNISSLLAFIGSGFIVAPLALTAAAFSIIGNYFGSCLALKNGYKIIKPVIIIVLVIFTLKIIFDL